MDNKIKCFGYKEVGYAGLEKCKDNATQEHKDYEGFNTMLCDECSIQLKLEIEYRRKNND